MARVSNPLIGKSRNKIGGVVFSSWKGINTLREKPATVANPQTDGQVSQRSAMTQIVAIARKVLGAIQISFRQRAIQMSEFNAFVKANLDGAFQRTGANAMIQPFNLVFSQGTLQGLQDLAFVSLTGRTIVVDWTDNSGQSGANASDKIHAIVVSDDGAEVVHIATAAIRSSETASVVVPGSWTLLDSRIIIYAVSDDQAQSSVSQNLPTA